MDKIWSIAAITFKEGIRNRAIQGILLIAALLCFGFLLVIPMFAFETGKVMVDLGASAVSLAGLVIVLFLGISMLTRDVHQRSICLILSRPVSRSDYVLGKFGGLAFLVLIAVLLVTVMATIASAIGLQFVLEMSALRNFLWSRLAITVGFSYLSLLVLLSVAFLFTVVTTNEYLSMLLTFMLYIIGNSLETMVKVASAGQDIKLNEAYIGILKVISWILPNFSVFDMKTQLAYGLDIPANQAFWSLIYGIAYITIIIAVTTFVFNRREIR
jgi:ABC-type transport system involved in multi-copper enzyme maturation permease subunit